MKKIGSTEEMVKQKHWLNGKIGSMENLVIQKK